MAHALKRIAFATCFPDQQQFTFIAREPKATTDEQFCHAFRARSAREVIAVTFVFFIFKIFIFIFDNCHCCRRHCTDLPSDQFFGQCFDLVGYTTVRGSCI